MATRSEWDAWIAKAKARPIREAAEAEGARLKRLGADWVGPCRRCGGNDRFAVHPGKGVFNCRGAEGGDVIAMVMHIAGCSFIEACERLTGEQRLDHSRDETEEERQSRLKWNVRRAAGAEARAEKQRKAEEAKARRDEESITDVLERAVSIDQSDKGMAYLKRRRLASSSPRLLIDIRYVEELAYWGYRDNGSGREEKLVNLATLPAVVGVIRDVRGAVIGLAETYLGKNEPRKWISEGSPRNSPKKVRGHKKGGMIRLGQIGETLALSEGWENALAYIALGLCDNEGITFAAAVDLGNLSGRATGTIEHPWLKNKDGKPVRVSNGEPDPEGQGVIIPEGVKSIIILGDADSEPFGTAMMLTTATKRFLALGIDTSLRCPEHGRDFNDMLIREIQS